MTIVLTNDDGIDAPGLQALDVALNGEGMIVAPLDHHSGCGHQVTTHRPLVVQRRSDRHFAIAGTPADCTRVALRHLSPQVEWVVSGINAGGNLGADVYTSGTVAAVREAAFHRIPGIAISHYIHRRQPIDWARAARMTADVLTKLFQHPLEPGSFWNVNLPHLAPEAPDPDIVFCHLCTQPLPVDYVLEGESLRYVGNYGDRLRDPGADVDVCFSGNIAVTKLHVGGIR